jgi:hypothetical protein
MNSNELRLYRLATSLDSLYVPGSLDFVEFPEDIEPDKSDQPDEQPPKKPKLVPGRIDFFQLPGGLEVSDLRAA